MVSILILTNSRDGQNTEAVASKLMAMGASVNRLDVDSVSTGKHQLHASWSGSHVQAVIDTGSSSFELGCSDSIWLRRPYEFEFEIQDRVQRDVAEEEVRDVFDGLYASLEDAFWVSRPAAIGKARLKLFQLKVAGRVGLVFPDSIVTNSPVEAKAFSEAGSTVFKPLSGYSFEYDDSNPILFTTLLTAEHRERMDLVVRQPVLLQRYIRKQFEVRVTYANGTFFAASIRTDDYQDVVDWRLPETAERVEYDVHKLPDDIESRLRRLITIMVLEYAAIDLVVDDSGVYHFLEINPNGQWLWIENETGLAISQAIADSLLKGGEK